MSSKKVFFVVALFGFLVAGTLPVHARQTREYWIAVESNAWNMAPFADSSSGRKISAEEATFTAIRYVSYSPNFSARLKGDELLGIAGPVIEADVGDHVVIHFKNMDEQYKRPHSIHVHGFDYDPSMDGGFSADTPNKPGTAVRFGETFTYEYDAGAASAGIWPYHDHSVDALGNMSRGMFGAIRIYGNGEEKSGREFFVFLSGFETKLTGLKEDFDTINGLAYMGNTPHFMAKLGEKVRFNVLAFGSEFHTFHVHGYHWKDDGHIRDVKVIGPGMAWSIEFLADKSGEWMYHCHVDDHMAHGMMGMFSVM